MAGAHASDAAGDASDGRGDIRAAAAGVPAERHDPGRR